MQGLFYKISTFLALFFSTFAVKCLMLRLSVIYRRGSPHKVTNKLLSEACQDHFSLTQVYAETIDPSGVL